MAHRRGFTKEQSQEINKWHHAAMLLIYVKTYLGSKISQNDRAAAKNRLCSSPAIPINLGKILVGISEEQRNELFQNDHRKGSQLQKWWEENHHVFADYGKEIKEKRVARNALRKLTPEERAMFGLSGKNAIHHVNCCPLLFLSRNSGKKR